MNVNVAIIMGSDSDLPVMQPAADILAELGVTSDVDIVSAHRTPEKMFAFARSAIDNGYKIIIAGAGGAAHLPGMVAALTVLPVIGVPVAAYQSYEAWASSGIAANEFSMSVLSNKVPTPTIFLLGSGLIMVLTLWFSSKAKKVVKTSLDLSDQNDIKERFRPNFLSRLLVRFFVGLNQYFSNLFPAGISNKISGSF